jgi:hypothetical protein
MALQARTLDEKLLAEKENDDACPDVSIDDRMIWAALSGFVGTAQDGPEIGTDCRMFQRIQAACSHFEIGENRFHDVAAMLDYIYYRPWDCYLGRDQFEEARRLNEIAAASNVTTGTLR